MRQITYHPGVPKEVREIIFYYESISYDLADEFWNELKSVLDRIQEFPERHHYDVSGRRGANLKKFHYHVLFRVFETHVRVTVVKHNRRNPAYRTNRK